MLQALPLVFVLAGLALYTVLGGTDLGAGFWQLAVGDSQQGKRVGEYAHCAMAPLWEANHVWLIFVLTIFWTAYAVAFGSIASTLAVPIVSGLAGLAALGLVHLRRYELARYCAAVAVAGIIAGWALARWPTILPGLTVDQAAAGHDTLVCVVVTVLAGGVIVCPALALLFGLTLAGRFRAEPQAVREVDTADDHSTNPRLPARLGIACLIAGVGLLNVADAASAHGLGIVCLIGFVVTAFGAIALPVADEQQTTRV